MTLGDLFEQVPGAKFYLDEHLLSLGYKDDLNNYWTKFKECDLGNCASDLAAEFRCEETTSTNVWIKRSSGTTGVPKTTIYGEKFYFRQQFVPLRQCYWRSGLEPRSDSIVLCINNSETTGSHITKDPANWFNAIVTINVDERNKESLLSIGKIIDSIRPHLVLSKPPLFEAMISEEVLQRGKTPRLYVSGGCRLTDNLRNELANTTGATVLDCYASSEFSVLAIGCIEDAGLHISMDSVTINCAGDQLETGGLVVASFHGNSTQPMPFATGDLGRIDEQRCRCGSSFPRIVNLRGKHLPIFLNARGAYFDPSRLHRLLDSYFNITEFNAQQCAVGELDLFIPASAVSDRKNAIVHIVSSAFGGAVRLHRMLEPEGALHRFKRHRNITLY